MLLLRIGRAGCASSQHTRTRTRTRRPHTKGGEGPPRFIPPLSRAHTQLGRASIARNTHITIRARFDAAPSPSRSLPIHATRIHFVGWCGEWMLGDDDRGRHAGARLATVFGTRGAHARRQAGRADGRTDSGFGCLIGSASGPPLGRRGGRREGGEFKGKKNVKRFSESNITGRATESVDAQKHKIH